MQTEFVCPLCKATQPNAISAKQHLMEVHKVPEDQIGDLEEIAPHGQSSQSQEPVQPKVTKGKTVKKQVAATPQSPPPYIEPKKEENLAGGQQKNMQNQNGPIPTPTAEELAHARQVINDQKRIDAINAPPIGKGGDVYNTETGQTGNGRKINSSDSKTLFIALGSAILVLVVGGMFWLNPGYNKSINSVAKQFTSMITDAKTADATANSTNAGNIASLQTKYDGLITADEATIKTLQEQLSTLQSNVATAQSLAQTAQTAAQTAQTAAQTAQSTANSGASQSAIATAVSDAIGPVSANQQNDETAITGLKAQLTTDEATIATLKGQITTLMTPVTTTTSTSTTTGTTSTLNGVTASITGTSNWITGTNSSAAMTITPSSPSGTFGINVANTTGATINNFQIGLVFAIVDSAGGTIIPFTPSATTCSLTDNTVTNVWSINTNTGYNYIVGFENGVSGSNPFGLGGWSVPNGSGNNYTMTFTLTGSGTPTSGVSYYITPIKIVIINN